MPSMNIQQPSLIATSIIPMIFSFNTLRGYPIVIRRLLQLSSNVPRHCSSYRHFPTPLQSCTPPPRPHMPSRSLSLESSADTLATLIRYATMIIPLTISGYPLATLIRYATMIIPLTIFGYPLATLMRYATMIIPLTISGYPLNLLLQPSVNIKSIINCTAVYLSLLIDNKNTNILTLKYLFQITNN